MFTEQQRSIIATACRADPGAELVERFAQRVNADAAAMSVSSEAAIEALMAELVAGIARAIEEPIPPNEKRPDVMRELHDEVSFLMAAQSYDKPKQPDIIEEARNANPELFSNTAAADPLGDALERQRIANARLLHKDDDLNPQAPSDWDMDGQGVVEAMPAVSNVPPEIAALLDDGETLTRDVRRKLTERLNVELAELKNLRGLAGEDLKREAEIEKLLGLFARLGEI